MRTLLTVTALLLATSARADGPPAWDGSYVTPPVVLQLVAAPVVIQDQPPRAEDWETHNRIVDLQRRVAALEAEHAKLGLRQPQTMPVPAGYQTTQATSSSYFAASVPVGLGDAAACATGDCGAGGRSYRVTPFGGRFRRR